MAQKHIHTFIEELIEEKGFKDLTHKMREEMTQDIKKSLDEFVIVRSLAQFSEEETQQFNQMLNEKKSGSELQQFITEHISDYETFLSETIIAFREAYLS